MIETQNLLIREFTPDDAEAIHAIAQKKGFHFYALDGTRETAACFVKRAINLSGARPRHSFKLAVAQKHAPQTCIGYTAFDDLHAPEDGTPDIGYLIDPTFQRRGFATEAMGATMRHCYATHAGLDVVWLTVHPENFASQRVAAKLGFNRVNNDIHQKTYGPRYIYSTDRHRLQKAGIIGP